MKYNYYSKQQRILLGSCERNEMDVKNYGYNKQIEWSDQSNMLALLVIISYILKI